PAALADNSKDRGDARGQGAAREAVLPARSQGQGGAHERRRESPVGRLSRPSRLGMSRVPAMRTLENALRRVGFVYVAGVDEVGRGWLAGTVVVAVVEVSGAQNIQ